MDQVSITDEAAKLASEFTIPHELGFGKILAPVMIVCDYKKGEWGKMTMLPYGPISMDPCSKVLHYGQEIFEGLKAYNSGGQGARLFRPDQNAERFNHSARRMAMPELPTKMFYHAVSSIAQICEHFIPKRSGESLYIRPFMFASEEFLGIRPSQSFKFMVVASPSARYFEEDGLKVFIERKKARACIGGTGNAKTGGNYAASLLSANEALEHGYAQTLWLDARTHSTIEEMSGMNFFAVKQGVLFTPKLHETILAGITRDSLISIALDLGIEVREETMKIEELIQDIKTGKVTELFACGTAVIVTPISLLGEIDGTHYPVTAPKGPVARKLKEHLLGIQEGRIHGPISWSVSCSQTRQ